MVSEPRPTPIVSYAQHYEDVRLARCFPGLTQGFYIDIGAWHPMVDSVTFHFYKLGWHGINVEPTPEPFALLERYRRRDRNLACLVGDRAGEQTIHVVDGTGLSTTSVEYAARAQESGLASSVRTTSQRTLSDICAEHDPETIHFLKVDVEGDEPAVLRGHDWTRWRPWVVVVEGTEPNSPIRTDAACRPILAAAGYVHATFDGLNDFYVANEQAALAGRLTDPITPFEVEGCMRERVLGDVHRNGPLGQWYQAYQQAVLAEALSRDPADDVRAYQRSFVISPEMRPGDREIKQAYRMILGRETDTNSLSTWLELINGGDLSLNGFLQMLCSSDEYLTSRLAAEAFLQINS